MRIARFSLLPLFLVLSCATRPAAPTDAPMSTDDAAIGCAPVPPADAPLGASVGRSFQGFTLPQCNGEPYTLYDDAFCTAEHTFTVVSLAALWCIPCQHESAQLNTEITERYRGRGVRVVQILVDGETPGSGVRPEDCTDWVRTYGLLNPELMDTSGVTNVYSPDGALPATFIVDEHGVIRFRETGAAMGLVSLRAALDALLAGS